MTKTPAGKLFAGFLLFLGSISQAHAQGPATSPEQMLDPRLAPKQDNVILSTPSAEELKSCSVVSVPGAGGKSAGYLLLDANKKPLRRFYDSKGAGTVDVWCYYKDGIEVYREFDTTYKGKPNNFRWLNSGGMKWGVGGVDAKGNGFITSWVMLSAEEAAFEAFQALARQDFARLQTLFLTDTDVQTLKLPAAQAKRLNEIQQQASKKFSDLGQSLNLAGAKFEVVEGAVPSCDTTGDVETIRFASRAIRYEIKGDHKWIHTGEMIRVGMAWRLVDVPSDKDPGTGGPTDAPAGTKVAGSPELEALLNQLAQHDIKAPQPKAILAKDPEVQKYYEKRIELLQKIVRLDGADQREGWYKQLFDNYTAAAQNSGDDASLKSLKDTVVSQMPGTNLAAYGVYRHAWTRYAIDTAKNPDDQKTVTAAQDKWLEDLAEFVNRYSKAEDTPEALHQLAIGSEFAGQTAKAKRYYTQLAEAYPNHHLAARSRGSVARLDLVGNSVTLSAPRLDTGAAFDIAQLKGKLVIVHYWRSQNGDQYKDDFARLKLRLAASSAKDLVLVSVNLDDDAATARDAVAKTQAPGIHLYQAPSNNSGGGLNGPLATQYGIHVLPTLFLVNRDGRVTTNSLQIGDIETELRKVN